MPSQIFSSPTLKTQANLSRSLVARSQSRSNTPRPGFVASRSRLSLNAGQNLPNFLRRRRFQPNMIRRIFVGPGANCSVHISNKLFAQFVADVDDVVPS